MDKKKLGFVLCLVALLSLFGVRITQAQEQAGWSAVHRLSSEEGSASEGFMVSDQYGYVHVFWAEDGLPEDRSIIQYARFDGENWSTPLDIYTTRPGATREGRAIGFVSPFVDQKGLLHLAWAEGNNGPVYYSTAPVYDALSAHNWSSPIRVDIPANWIRLLVDSKGTLHIVYNSVYGDQPGVYYVRSEDQGETWSSPYWFDPDIPFDYLPSWLQFGLDSTDGLHVVWNYFGKSIHYSHSLDGGSSWSLPFTIDEPANETDVELRLSHPGLLVQDQTVHVIWGGGSSEENDAIYREYRYSTDAGQTWSAPTRLLGNLNGQAAGGGLAVDAAGRLHYAAQVRYPKAIWHTYLDQGHWSTPSMIYQVARTFDDPEEINHIHAHNVRLAFRNGNQLVTTFTNSPGEEEPLVLYAMYHTLGDVSPLAALPTPTPKPTVTPTPMAVNSTPIALAVAPTPIRPKFTDTTSELTSTPSPTQPLWLGLAPVLVLLGGAMVFQLFRRR